MSKCRFQNVFARRQWFKFFSWRICFDPFSHFTVWSQQQWNMSFLSWPFHLVGYKLGMLRRTWSPFFCFVLFFFSPHDHVLMCRVLFQQQGLVSHICSTCCCHVWFQSEAWLTSSWWWRCTEQTQCNVLETWSAGDDRRVFKCFLFSVHTLSTGLTYHPAGAKLQSFPDIPLWFIDKAF